MQELVRRPIAAAVMAAIMLAASVLGSASPVSAVGTSASGMWSLVTEKRISPRPTSLTTRSREPIATAHPYDPSRVAVVYAYGPGEDSRPVIRISHDGGRTWRTVSGRPRGGGSHPM